MENIQGSLRGGYAYRFCITSIRCRTCKHSLFAICLCNSLLEQFVNWRNDPFVTGLSNWNLWIKLPSMDCSNGGSFQLYLPGFFLSYLYNNNFLFRGSFVYRVCFFLLFVGLQCTQFNLCSSIRYSW